MWAELESMAGRAGLEVIDPNGKMEEVLFLVEWPTVVEGHLRASTISRCHPRCLSPPCSRTRRYFPLVDDPVRLSQQVPVRHERRPAWSEADHRR